MEWGTDLANANGLLQCLHSYSTIHTNAAKTAPAYIPSDEPQVNNVFCFVALADKHRSTMYTVATGALPAMSVDGHQYYFVAYDYDTNYILADQLKDR